jgi:hypothetical protein
MKLPRLKFTSYRDAKGYRLIGKEPPPKGKADRGLDTPIGEITSGRLEEGYEWEDGELMPRYGEWISGYIVGKGGKPVPINLNQWPHAFTEFAAIKTPDELTAFITKFGPLTHDKRQVAIDLLEEARRMRECVQDKRESPGKSLNLSTLLIRDRKTGELEVETTPRSLLDALWLQFQHELASGADFRICPLCKEPFAAGGETGRPRKAQFCSPEHRKRYNSLARSNPSMKARRQASRSTSRPAAPRKRPKKRRPTRRGKHK